MTIPEGRRSLAILAASWLLLACSESTAPQQGAVSKAPPAASDDARASVTFNRDVAPILYANCSVCHRPGEAAPFSLLTFEDAKKRARQIARVTASRYMPPWLPEPGYGDFLGERRLTEEQIGILQKWAKQGTPQGDPSERAEPPQLPSGWQLGQPDLVLSLPRAYTLSPEGIDVFRNFVFSVPVRERRYVRALEIRPFNKQVVHHANLLIDRSGISRRRDEQEAGVGFSGMDLEIESASFEPQSHFLFWKPGSALSPGSDEMSWRVDPATDLVLNMHMQPSGKPEKIQPELGLYLSDSLPSLFPMLLQLERDGELDIPAGEKDFVVNDHFKLPVGLQVLGVYPHAHYLGKGLQAYAILPDGSRQWLIWIPDWDLNWQAVYEYKQPLRFPKGTVLHMRYSYDNSADNPRNPSSPPRRVVAGNQSTDEMSHLWIQVLPDRPDDRKRLEEALMRRRLEKYPQDPFALANLGSVLQSQGRISESIEPLRQALALKPNDAAARNSLGAALLSAGKSAQAIVQFEQALRWRPGYPDALYNLGNALISMGRMEEAERRFRQLLQTQADDWGVRAGLAQTLIAQGKPAQAARQFERAIELHPQNAELYNGLGSALALQGDFFGAIRHFGKALQLRPDFGQAHENLGESLAAMQRFEEAIPHLKEALRLNPQDADLCNDLGSAYAASGNLKEAARHFERVLQIAPGHAVAQRNLQRARSEIKRRRSPGKEKRLF